VGMGGTMGMHNLCDILKGLGVGGIAGTNWCMLDSWRDNSYSQLFK
jgi:hypothetical protein